jgi:hypothetical protein
VKADPIRRQEYKRVSRGPNQVWGKGTSSPVKLAKVEEFVKKEGKADPRAPSLRSCV